MKTISQAEKTDILLALAMAFEKNSAKTGRSETVGAVRELAAKSFSALNKADLESLKARAGLLDELTPEKRENWREMRLDKVRGRRLSKRLDENINPSHIVEVLSREPKAVQILILRNLPPDLSRRISLYLDLNFVPDEGASKNGTQINEEIVALIRHKFLANFIALEDVYEPDDLDRFSVDAMENFIRQLGLREIAIACRGINSKETLAAFLNRFDEDDAREIALYITELDKIRPFWVAQADELVRKSWSADLPPARVIKKIGFKLLATGFILRSETSREYAAQKLSIREVKNWQRLVNVFEKKYLAADEEEKLRFDKRRRIIERLALKFAQTGKL
jgi:2-oxo-4-hydroxy-4-carboxy--5-ureidoimidazoline (OHCU) decarboxylase